MGGGFGPTVALPLLHLHCEREREGEGDAVCLCACYKLDFMQICEENIFHVHSGGT